MTSRTINIEQNVGYRWLRIVQNDLVRQRITIKDNINKE